MYRNIFLAVILVCISSLWACEKEGICTEQGYTLKEYTCFEATTARYVLQNADDLAHFIDETACKVCDCMPQVVEIDFVTQTGLSVYTENCGNTLAVCRNDEDKQVIYTLTSNPIDCLVAVPDYNLIVVSKIPDDYTVEFVIE